MTATAAAAGVGARSALLAAAILCGQLSVGWCNDAVDAAADTLAARPDKPIATGDVSRELVARSAVVAVVLDVPLSLSLGWRAGAAHLVAVGWAWSYNLGLKRSVASPLPYAVAFGLMPVLVAAMLSGAPRPRIALVIAGACCGVAGHFANTVGDTRADTLTGVRGLPQRFGPAASTVVAGGFIALAAVAVLVAVGAGVITVGAVVIDAAIAAVLPFVLRSREVRRLAFGLVIVAVSVLVAAFVISGGSNLTNH
jgi:4-hydroxybenzoate polyprenyltransferase